MNEISEEEIINLIEKKYWKSNLSSNSDIFLELRIDGDDCEELLSNYALKYSVDMSNFLWYFHYQDEASINDIFGLIYKKSYQFVQYIPITPIMLTEFANSKKWNINYPEHKLPKYRNDININFFLFISVILFLIILLFKKY